MNSDENENTNTGGGAENSPHNFEARQWLVLVVIVALGWPIYFSNKKDLAALDWVAFGTVGITMATAMVALAGVLNIYRIDKKVLTILLTAVILEIAAVFIAVAAGAFQKRDPFVEMKEALDLIPLPVAILDENKSITYANKTFAQLWIDERAGPKDALNEQFGDLLDGMKDKSENFTDFNNAQIDIKNMINEGQDPGEIPRVPLIQHDKGNDFYWAWYPESTKLPSYFPEHYKILSVARFEVLEDSASANKQPPIVSLWKKRNVEAEEKGPGDNPHK